MGSWRGKRCSVQLRMCFQLTAGILVMTRAAAPKDNCSAHRTSNGRTPPVIREATGSTEVRRRRRRGFIVFIPDSCAMATEGHIRKTAAEQNVVVCLQLLCSLLSGFSPGGPSRRGGPPQQASLCPLETMHKLKRSVRGFKSIRFCPATRFLRSSLDERSFTQKERCIFWLYVYSSAFALPSARKAPEIRD